MNKASLERRSDFRQLLDHLPEVAIWFVSDRGEFEYISSALLKSSEGYRGTVQIRVEG